MVFQKVITYDPITTPLKDLPTLEDAFIKNYDPDLSKNRKTRTRLNRCPLLFKRYQKQLMIRQETSIAHVQRITTTYGLALFEKKFANEYKVLRSSNDLDISSMILDDIIMQYHPSVPCTYQPTWIQTLEYVSSKIESLSTVYQVSKSYIVLMVLCLAYQKSDFPVEWKDHINKEADVFSEYVERAIDSKKRSGKII